MTLKADDVQRNRNGRLIKDQNDADNKMAISGLAQPGPQSPEVYGISQCKTKPNSNEEDESGTRIIYTTILTMHIKHK